jgi:hypothetical protein
MDVRILRLLQRHADVEREHGVRDVALVLRQRMGDIGVFPRPHALREVRAAGIYFKHETSVWLEITTLLIPGENDSPTEIEHADRDAGSAVFET